MLSQIYFENLFCLLPFPSASTSTSTRAERSELGIKVALGDSSTSVSVSGDRHTKYKSPDGPETTHIVIFAQRTDDSTKTIRLLVGRVTPRPVQPQSVARGPRPDDPIPRKPPAFPIRDLKRTGSLSVIGAGRELKRVASSGSALTAPLKRQKTAGEGDAVFKVPELPNGKGKQQENDVFGELPEDDVSPSTSTGKQKADDADEAALDKANKIVCRVFDSE